MKELDHFIVDERSALQCKKGEYVNIPLRVRELVAGGVTHGAKTVGIGQFGSYFVVLNDGRPFNDLQQDIINVGNRSAHNAESVHKTGTKKAIYNLMNGLEGKNVAIILSKVDDLKIKALVVVFEKETRPGLCEFFISKHDEESDVWEIHASKEREALFEIFFGKAQWRDDILKLIPKFDDGVKGWNVAFALQNAKDVVGKTFKSNLSKTALSVLEYCQHSYPRIETGDNHQPFCHSASISPQFIDIGDYEHPSVSKAPWHSEPKGFQDIWINGVRVRAVFFSVEPDHIKENHLDVGVSYGRHVITTRLQSCSTGVRNRFFKGTLIMLQLPSFSSYQNTKWTKNGVWRTRFKVEDIFQQGEGEEGISRANRLIEYLDGKSCLQLTSGGNNFNVEVCCGDKPTSVTPAIIRPISDEEVELQISASVVSSFFKQNSSVGVDIRFSIKPVFPIKETKTGLQKSYSSDLLEDEAENVNKKPTKQESVWEHVKRAMGFDNLITHPWFNQPKALEQDAKSLIKAKLDVVTDPQKFDDFISNDSNTLMAWRIIKSRDIVLCPMNGDHQPQRITGYERCEGMDFSSQKTAAMHLGESQTNLAFIQDCLQKYKDDKDLDHLHDLQYNENDLINYYDNEGTISMLRFPNLETDTDLLERLYSRKDAVIVIQDDSGDSIGKRTNPKRTPGKKQPRYEEEYGRWPAKTQKTQNSRTKTPNKNQVAQQKAEAQQKVINALKEMHHEKDRKMKEVETKLKQSESKNKILRKSLDKHKQLLAKLKANIETDFYAPFHEEQSHSQPSDFKLIQELQPKKQ